MPKIQEPKEMYLYGSVALQRAKCKKCKRYSFVKHNKTVCCNAVVITDQGESKVYGRISEMSTKRKALTKVQKDKILARQFNRCIYCDMSFGAIRTRNGEFVLLSIEWEHKLPVVLSGNNREDNYAAACQVCNGIKSDTLFTSLSAAKEYIMLRRKEKGYDF